MKQGKTHLDRATLHITRLYINYLSAIAIRDFLIEKLAYLN